MYKKFEPERINSKPQSGWFENNMIRVIDDFIDKEYQEKIKEIMLGSELYFDDHPDGGVEFPWYFIEDVTSALDTDSQHRPALAHQYVTYDGQAPGYVESELHSLFIPLLQRACFLLGIGQVNALQGRSFLQFPLRLKDKTVDTPHIDLENVKHFVVLYYVCDSDGDTIIYNEREESETYTVKKRVTPKQGRVVLFDGGLMHTAEQPINSNVRCIVNYDLI